MLGYAQKLSINCCLILFNMQTYMTVNSGTGPQDVEDPTQWNCARSYDNVCPSFLNAKPRLWLRKVLVILVSVALHTVKNGYMLFTL